MSDQVGTVTIENAQIIFRNFAGAEGQYNRAGDRNFSVILDPELARQMLADGWNVRELPAREEGDDPTPYIQVAVSFKNRPPRVVMLTSRKRTNLEESNVEMLDFADIAVADLIIRPYHWEVNGKGGIKAYLQSLFITLAEDELERKYAINEVED